VTSRRLLPSTSLLSRRAKLAHSSSSSTPARSFQVLVYLMSSPVSHLLLTPPPVFRLGTSAISKLHVCKPSSPVRQRMSAASRIQSRASLAHRVYGPLSWWAFLMSIISNGSVQSQVLMSHLGNEQGKRRKKETGKPNLLVEKTFFNSEMMRCPIF